MTVYRLSAAAQEDIVELLAYTEVNFGEIARRRYEWLLITVLRDVASDPAQIGIGRVLHDAMELETHLPTDYGAD